MKNTILRIALVLSLVLSLAVIPAHAAYDYTYAGDANYDYELSISDVVIIRAYIVGMKTYDEGDNFFTLADVNEDGKINIVDVVMLRSFIVTDDYGATVSIQNDDYTLAIGDDYYISNGEEYGQLPSGVTFKDKTLTLNNANIYLGTDINSAIYCDDDLTIELIGNNNIVGRSGEDVTGIYVEGDLAISGTGSLTFTNFSTGIYSERPATIGGKFTFNDVVYPIAAYDDVTFDSANITATNPEVVITSFGNITAKKSVIDATASMGIVTFGTVDFLSTEFSLTGNSGIMAFDAVSINDSKLDINCVLPANPTEDDISVGIFSTSSIAFGATAGTIKGEDAAIYVFSEDLESKAIEFKGTSINEGYEYSHFVADSEDGYTLLSATITDGEGVVDTTYETGFANTATSITLELSPIALNPMAK